MLDQKNVCTDRYVKPFVVKHAMYANDKYFNNQNKLLYLLRSKFILVFSVACLQLYMSLAVGPLIQMSVCPFVTYLEILAKRI